MTQSETSPAARRGFLKLVLAGMAGTVGMLLYPVARFLQPLKKGGGGALEVVAPYRADELKLGADGKWPAPFNFGGRPCLLIKNKAGEVKAFDAVCTHVDCTVQFRPDKQDIFCNCHNGTYDLDGRNVAGPPPRPLTTLNVELRGEPGKEEIVVRPNQG